MVTPADCFDPSDRSECFDTSHDADRPLRPRRAYRSRGADMSANVVTDSGRAANRANAAQSTGPRTPDGKSRASRNSTSHGIFCRDLLLDGEDAWLFGNIRESVIRRLRPQDALELMFVDRIVQAQWRLNRCQGAERHAHRTVAVTARRRATSDAAELRRYHGFTTREELQQRGRRGDDAALAKLDELDDLTHPEQHAGLTLMLGVRGGRALDRLGNYEQRLERTMHRALRELRLLRGKDARAWEDLPESPYAGTVVEGDEGDEGDDAVECEHRVDGDTRPPSHLAREFSTGGERNARGVEAAGSAESSDAHLRNEPASLHTVPPHPNPLPRGERGLEKEKNEPESALTHFTASTGENSLVEPDGDIAVATSGVPGGSSATGSEKDATPDALVVTDSAPTSDRPPPANSSR